MSNEIKGLIQETGDGKEKRVGRKENVQIIPKNKPAIDKSLYKQTFFLF